MVRKLVAACAFAAFGFAVAGPLQHVGVLPETTVGNASKAAIKSALNLGVSEAWDRCGPSLGGKGQQWLGQRGRHRAGKLAGARQPKFEDPNTGLSPSRSPSSGGGDR
jgi:hypothetical protein